VKGKISSSSNKLQTGKDSSFSNIILIILIIFLSAVVVFLSYSLYLKIQNISQSKNKSDHEVPSAIIQVEVLNGCGVEGVAAKFTTYLRQNNFDVVQVGNYTSNNIDETMIIDRIGNRANTEKLADVLGINKKNIIQQLNKDYFLDATLVIGKDYKKFEPLN
jgi:cell division protein YceG involved in septum cleavage